ncbi:unnamed protein product [Protopolystoma xenopodis]|uniref:Uncharacterized protein n=1 Tax=Protopolystoma xenopodis TaxID=117903 RepID=A0A3S5AV77_9PLAT|nr:unnamed protein product [Protopolystoma xenopodis]
MYFQAVIHLLCWIPSPCKCPNSISPISPSFISDTCFSVLSSSAFICVYGWSRFLPTLVSPISRPSPPPNPNIKRQCLPVYSSSFPRGSFAFPQTFFHTTAHLIPGYELRATGYGPSLLPSPSSHSRTDHVNKRGLPQSALKSSWQGELTDGKDEVGQEEQSRERTAQGSQNQSTESLFFTVK